MHKLLFITRYVDHILYFFLDQLSRRTKLRIVVDETSKWTQRLVDSQIGLTYLAPRSKFDRDFRNAISALEAQDGGWDLIQCFHGNAQLANMIRWNRRGTPLIAYRARIGRLKFRENPNAYWSVRNPSLSATAVVSNQVKAYLESFWVLNARNARVIPHGVNRQWIESQTAQRFGLREKLGIGENELIVASIATLRPVKRFEYIVHAAGKLSELPIHFVHVGEPNGWDQKASHLPKVHFLGRQSKPFPILADADVFTMTSHNEAFGRANLEAMACGKPVIGSNTGGLLDLVEPGVTGQLFDTNDPDDFAAIVKQYSDDRASIFRHGENAIKRVDQLFTTEKMTEQYLNLYDDVLASANSIRRTHS